MKTNAFDDPSIKRSVLRQVIPAVATRMITLFHSLADTYIVGLLNAPIQTAAITVATAPSNILSVVSGLFSVGGTTVIASHLGKRDLEKVKQSSAITFWCSILFSVVFSLIFFAFAEPIMYLCGATAETYEQAYGYVKWVVIIGGPLSMASGILSSLIRAEGGATASALGSMLSGFVNVILNPFFTLPRFLGYGVIGAGIATVLAQFVPLVFYLSYLLIKRNQTVLSLQLRQLRHTFRHLWHILVVGFPSAVQYGLTVVAMTVQTRFVAQYETEAIAAMGIVKRLDQLPLYFTFGIANGLLPLLAYHNAAGNHLRRKESFRFGCVLSFGFALLCLVAYELFAPHLVGLFIQDSKTIAYGSDFLRIMVIAMPLMSLCYPMIIQFQAMKKMKASLICSMLRKGVIDIPLFFLLDGLFALYGCMMVQPIVDGIALIVAVVFYARINRSLGLTPKKRIAN